jgi:hypothetical protein
MKRNKERIQTKNSTIVEMHKAEIVAIFSMILAFL